ncbi:MAG: DNA polymerase [Verrucomicrobia bacterium]|nr:MAG: DNA polymerase [Verrucomicrobiota bacterium]
MNKQEEKEKFSICGVWAGPEGRVYLSLKEGEGRKEISVSFSSYLWLEKKLVPNDMEFEKLGGGGPLDCLMRFPDIQSHLRFLNIFGKGNDIENIDSFENQYLLEHHQRLFLGMHFDELRRCQCDIETACSVPKGFSDPHRPGDRILAIGLKSSNVSDYLVLEEFTDAAEIALLQNFNKVLQALDPDILEGHNIFKFDLDYLRVRSQRLGVPLAWGRFGQMANFRNSRFKIAERWLDYPRYEIPGRAVFDTYLMIQLYDVAKRDLQSYGLKSVAVALGITNAENGERTYLQGNQIHHSFNEDRSRFIAYLEDDLRETKALSDFLLPTYFAQVKSFPMTLQEAVLRGSANKVDLLFLEKYFHAKEALPKPITVNSFEGGFTKTYEFGVFKKILHFDVASLYPSLLSVLGKNPKNDTLECFIPLLKELRAYRLEYKKLARETTDEALKREYEARQMSYKILINSFYGYLGFPGARFADSELAALVTAKGRELLQMLIGKFRELGCIVVEADTDGIYLSTEEYFENPQLLLQKVVSFMPEGVELEYDGSYPAMFSYKAKNYAVFDGKEVIIKGSALRSRGMEPFLKELTDTLIKSLLGVIDRDAKMLIEEIRSGLESGTIDVNYLAKSEQLSQNPWIYKRMVEGTKKPRRAALEVALKMTPLPKMGDKIFYYITVGEKARMPDWQLARSVTQYDIEKFPYDKKYYIKKLEEWYKRYKDFIL